jgi:hypothetical protein
MASARPGLASANAVASPAMINDRIGCPYRMAGGTDVRAAEPPGRTPATYMPRSVDGHGGDPPISAAINCGKSCSSGQQTATRDGTGFVEQSPILSMSLWRHERTLEAEGGAAILTDRLTFAPRFGRALGAWFIRTVFGHRHAVLRQAFASRR